MNSTPTNPEASTTSPVNLQTFRSLLIESKVYLPQPNELGNVSPSDPAVYTLSEKLDILRTWLRTGGLSTIAPGRGHDADLAVADALIDLAQQHRRTTLLPAGLEKLRSMAGLGSTSTVRSALGRLHKLIQRDIAGDKITKSDVYSLNDELFDHVVFTSRNPQDSESKENSTVRLTRSENVYTSHRAHDVFTTGRGNAGVQLGNLLPGAGKLLLLLIQTLINHAAPATGSRLASLTARNYNTVSRALARGHELGLLERTEENGKGIGRRYFYSVASAWEQRAALLAVDLRTYGAGVDRAADAAIGLHLHAQRLLNPENEQAPLDQAQRATLATWRDVSIVEYKALREISDLAGQVDKFALQAVIASASTEERNKRAIRAARAFIKAVPLSDDLSAAQHEGTGLRLFHQWATVNGYSDLTRPDYHAHLRLRLALRLARPHKPSPLLVPTFSPQPTYTQPELGVYL